MTIDRDRIFQLFKYSVYALLTLNVWLFFADEWAASAHRFSDGVAIFDVIEGFAATIDTAAWVLLLLIFELETYVLTDRHFTKRVIWTLHGIRTFCYVFIVYAAYGYLAKLVFLDGAVPFPGAGDLCALVDGRWAYLLGLEDYEILTAANCGGFSASDSLLKFPGVLAVIDRPGLVDIIRLAWVDVINATVWLLVVLNLEIDVRLQERQKFNGLVLKFSNLAKFVLYSVLFLAAAYWGVEGDFVDFWDAFLWLVAFIFIELNVLEWRQESAAVQVPSRPAPP